MTNSHGGARKGAGRKPVGDPEKYKVLVSFPKSWEGKMRDAAGGNMQEFIRNAVYEVLKNGEKSDLPELRRIR